MDIIRNPVIIGLTAGVITYYYMEYKSRKMNNEKKKKTRIRQLIISFVVAFIFWFIAYGYFDYSTIPVKFQPLNTNNFDFENVNEREYKFINDTSSSEPKSISLITNGITIPDRKLPDVTVDMF
jgi:hypothetical protein